MSDIFDQIGDKDTAGRGIPGGGDIFDTVSPERTIGGTAKDVGIDLLKGAISIPESAVGLADIFTGGQVGKGLEGVGFKPAEAKQILEEGYSPARKEAGRKFSEAEGLVDKAVAAVANPSVVASAVIESLPLMGAGGAVARGIPLLGAGGRALSGVTRAAIGEGTVAAGAAAEGVRQQTETGTLTPGQAAMAGVAGALTGAFAQLGGKAAQKLGIADVDTFLAGAGSKVKKNLARRTIEGFVTEGVFEELPQSLQEQMIQNISLDRPVFDGLDEAAVLGTLSGGVMGGAFNLASMGGGTEGTLPDIQKDPGAPLSDATVKIPPKGAVGKAAAAGGLRPEFKPFAARGIPSTAEEAASVLTGIPVSEQEKELNAAEKRRKEIEQTFATLPTEEQEVAAKAEAAERSKSDPVHDLRTEIRRQGGLNLDSLKVDYDSETTKEMISKLPGIVSRTGKVHYDEIADEAKSLGYDSADKLIEALAGVETKAAAVASAEKDIQAQRDFENRRNEEVDHLESKGFDPVFDKKPAVDLNKGDIVITKATEGLPADEYEVKGIDKDGKVILEDGVTKKVDAFDLVDIRGVKRSGKDGLGKPVKEEVEAEPSAAAPAPEPVTPSPAPSPAAAEGEVSLETPPASRKEIGKNELVNGITRSVAGDMMAAGDEAVLQHIKDGVKEHGVMLMEDAIRNQEISEVAAVPKEQRPAVRERIAKLRPQIDAIFDEARTPVSVSVDNIKKALKPSAIALLGDEFVALQEIIDQGLNTTSEEQWIKDFTELGIIKNKWKFGDKAADRTEAEAIAKNLDPRDKYGIVYDYKQEGRWGFTVRDLNGKVNGEPLGTKDMDGTFERVSLVIEELTPEALLDMIKEKKSIFLDIKKSERDTELGEKDDESARTDLIDEQAEPDAGRKPEDEFDAGRREPIQEREDVGAVEPSEEPQPEVTSLSTETVDNEKSIAHGHEVNTSPSEAMKEAENYKKAHVLVDGLEISVENPVGSTRSGTDASGKEWSQVMRSDYGYFKGSVGFDRDHVDVFLKPSYKGGNDTVHIVNQKKANGHFDEHKVVLGATSVKDALLIYNSNYEKGWNGAKSVVSMPIEDFQKWVKSAAPAKGEVEQRKYDKAGKRIDRRKDSPFRKKVSEMSRAELEERMLKDKLTGLDNERGFWERFVDGNHRYVLRADMDNLHDLNDILGYSGSDQLIKEVAKRSEEVGFYLAREKGDEFLGSEDDFDGLNKVAEKLQSLLDKTIIRVTAENGKVYEKTGIGVSYGIEESLGKAEAQQKLAKERSLAEGRRIQGRKQGVSAADLGLVEVTPEGRKPERGEAGDTVPGIKPAQGEVGGKFGPGEVVLTVTGRETTPFPTNLDTSTNRKATNTLKRIDAWLMDNAISEAESRGDDFNLRQFSANKDKPTTADKDSAEVYLFDPAISRIPVPEKILKDLVPEQKPEEPEPVLEKITTEEDTRLDSFLENSMSQLNDVMVELTGIREETGETVTFTEKAGDALKDVNNRLKAFNSMIDCVGA